MHTIILGAIICVFIYFVLHSANRLEPFKTSNKSGPFTDKNKPVTIADITLTNDVSFGLVEFSTVPFSAASSTIKVGLVKAGSIPKPRKINRPSDLFFSENIVGIKVPDGLRVTIYEDGYLQGYSNAIVGPSSVDNLESASLQYPEPEDENGNLLTNKYKEKGWKNRVKSFVVQRSEDIPEDFDGVFYTREYKINDHDKFVQMGVDPAVVADRTLEAQWQYQLDYGESEGKTIK